MTKNLDKRVKPGWAARVLGIAHSDLPRLDRSWTKRDVHQLRRDRPGWLTDARRRHATSREQATRERIDRLAAALHELGYTAADAGTIDQAVLYIDGARTHLMVHTGCSDNDADSAAWRHWPRSMAAEDDDTTNWLLADP